MEIRAEITRFDVAAVYLMLAMRLKIKYFAALAVAIGCFMYLSPDCLFDFWSCHPITSGLISLAAGLLYFVISTLLPLLSALMRSTEAAGILGGFEMTVNDDGVFVQNNSGHGLSHWNRFRHVGTVGPYLVLQLKNYTHHIVPKRCFSDPAAYDDFVLYAEQTFTEQEGLP